MKKLILLAIVAFAYCPPAAAMEIAPTIIGATAQGVAAQIPHIHVHIANTSSSSWNLLSPKYMLYTAALGGIYYGARKFGPLGFLRAIGANIFNYVYGVVSLPLIAPAIDLMNLKVDNLGVNAADTLQEIKAVAQTAKNINLTLVEQGKELYRQLEDTNKQLGKFHETLEKIAGDCTNILAIVHEQKRMLANQEILIKRLNAKSGRPAKKTHGRHKMFRKKLYA